EPPAYDLRHFKKESSVVLAPSLATGRQPAAVQPSLPSATRVPSPLISLTKDQVVAKYGPPSVTNADVLYYDRPAGTLRIYMTAGRVSSVKPEDFDFASLAPLPKAGSYRNNRRAIRRETNLVRSPVHKPTALRHRTSWRLYWGTPSPSKEPARSVRRGSK